MVFIFYEKVNNYRIITGMIFLPKYANQLGLAYILQKSLILNI